MPRTRALIFGAAKDWSVGAGALPAALGTHPQPGRGAGTAHLGIYFSCLVSSPFRSTKVLHCSICFCGISSPAGSRRRSKFRDGRKQMELVRFHLPAKLTKPGMPAEPCCGHSIPAPHLFHPLPAFCSFGSSQTILSFPKHFADAAQSLTLLLELGPGR